MNNKTEFIHGPSGKLVKIVETVSGTVTSTKQFIGGEERDGSGNVTKQFFARGQRNGTTNYFYAKDQLGSIRTMTDNSGVVQASYSFDPSGRVAKLEGSTDPDFGFGGMYVHARSGLNLATFRAYSPSFGRWINRDPAGESGGVNLYAYAASDPVNMTDWDGLTPNSIVRDTLILRSHFLHALDEFNKRERNRVKHGIPKSRPCDAGNEIDEIFKDFVRDDERLRHLHVTDRFEQGPDVYDRSRNVWWDVTTEGDWINHIKDYTGINPPHIDYGYGIGLLYNLSETTVH